MIPVRQEQHAALRWRAPHTNDMIMSEHYSDVAPAEVEGEDRLIHRLLRQHVVKHGVSQDLRQGRVAHPQDAVEPRHDKRGPGLVDGLAELLVHDAQITDLEKTTTIVFILLFDLGNVADTWRGRFVLGHFLNVF